ncbi:LppU/SCO3897 family protein [Kutzneria albida]|uniref:Uncharacterized protein n=1 Tax=Kutzneria albida DSM 43870 TaxID=1449976 RepID=W5W036_9PSEU|nr:hypothetical protein [Kutzneria albida]AHH93916.1 hypothetical protein KALB_540 [Kutzneria albida DSM 43870]
MAPVPGQPQPFPQAPVGTAAPKRRKPWLRFVIGAGTLIVAVIAYVGIRLVIGGVASNFNDAHQTAVGECAQVSGTMSKPHYTKTDCGSADANYTVAKVLSSSSATCGKDFDEYYETNAVNPVKLCLAPVFVDGQCYKFSTVATSMGYPKVACTDSSALQVKVVKGDGAANCEGGPEATLAYSEIKTTYCLAKPTGA